MTKSSSELSEMDMTSRHGSSVDISVSRPHSKRTITFDKTSLHRESRSRARSGSRVRRVTPHPAAQARKNRKNRGKRTESITDDNDSDDYTMTTPRVKKGRLEEVGELQTDPEAAAAGGNRSQNAALRGVDPVEVGSSVISVVPADEIVSRRAGSVTFSLADDSIIEDLSGEEWMSSRDGGELLELTGASASFTGVSGSDLSSFTPSSAGVEDSDDMVLLAEMTGAGLPAEQISDALLSDVSSVGPPGDGLASRLSMLHQSELNLLTGPELNQLTAQDLALIAHESEDARQREEVESRLSVRSGGRVRGVDGGRASDLSVLHLSELNLLTSEELSLLTRSDMQLIMDEHCRNRGLRRRANSRESSVSVRYDVDLTSAISGSTPSDISAFSDLGSTETDSSFTSGSSVFDDDLSRVASTSRLSSRSRGRTPRSRRRSSKSRDRERSASRHTSVVIVTPVTSQAGSLAGSQRSRTSSVTVIEDFRNMNASAMTTRDPDDSMTYVTSSASSRSTSSDDVIRTSSEETHLTERSFVTVGNIDSVLRVPNSERGWTGSGCESLSSLPAPPSPGRKSSAHRNATRQQQATDDNSKKSQTELKKKSSKSFDKKSSSKPEIKSSKTREKVSAKVSKTKPEAKESATEPKKTPAKVPSKHPEHSESKKKVTKSEKQTKTQQKSAPPHDTCQKTQAEKIRSSRKKSATAVDKKDGRQGKREIKEEKSKTDTKQDKTQPNVKKSPSPVVIEAQNDPENEAAVAASRPSGGGRVSGAILGVAKRSSQVLRNAGSTIANQATKAYKLMFGIKTE